MIISDFLKYIKTSTEERDVLIRGVMSLVSKYFNKHKGKVSQDEREDLFADIVCELYEAYSVWENDTSRNFGSIAYFRLMDWEKKIITKYTGIKVVRSDFRKSKATGIPIVLTKMEFQEAMGDPCDCHTY